MIIVSQDKDNIINFDNVENIDIVADLDGTGEVPYEIYYETKSKRDTLGRYKTEERAKDVLKEITNEYLKCNITNIVHNYAYVENRAYKMPEK